MQRFMLVNALRSSPRPPDSWLNAPQALTDDFNKAYVKWWSNNVEFLLKDPK